MKSNLKTLFYILVWSLLLALFGLGEHSAYAALSLQEGESDVEQTTTEQADKSSRDNSDRDELAENLQARRIKVNFFVNSIRAINDEAGTYEIDFWLELYWQNSELSGQIIEDIPTSQLWDPKINTINGQALTVLYRGYDNSFEPDTNIALYQRLSGTFHNRFNLEKFPFDQQWITISLESSEFTSNRLLLDFIDFDQPTVYTEQASIYPISIGKFISSDISLGQWSIIDAQIAQQIHVLPYDKSSWAQMRLEFLIVRDPQPYVLKIMLVLSFMMFLGIAIFFIDFRELRYRLLTFFTLLLAVTTLDFTRLQNMPKVAYITLMDIQILLCYLLMMFIVGSILGTSVLERMNSKLTTRVNRIVIIIYGLFFLSINIGLWFYATNG